MATTEKVCRDKILGIIRTYIEMLNSGHVKEGLREASKEEIEFSTALLQAIAADILAL